MVWRDDIQFDDVNITLIERFFSSELSLFWKSGATTPTSIMILLHSFPRTGKEPLTGSENDRLELCCALQAQSATP